MKWPSRAHRDAAIWLWGYVNGAVVTLAFIAFYVTCTGCGAYDSAKAGVKKVGGIIGGEAAEYTLCPLDVIECGHVFQCEGTRADTPSGYIEICIDDDDHPEQLDAIESTYGECAPTPRHQGLCWYRCPGQHGCNSYNGCWCPSA